MIKHNYITPNNLKKGDKIAIISPSGVVSNPETLNNTISLIKSQGYVPVIGANATKSFYHNGYTFAGTDEERKKDLIWAFSDPSIKAIWASRGGYGAVRLRTALIDIINKHQQIKWYIGYSDNTYISYMLLNHGYVKSIYGANIINSYGSPDKSYQHIFDILKGNTPGFSIESHKKNDNANVEGILLGGNVSLIYSMLGTADNYKKDNIILFLEDLNESYYSMDRMLNAIKLSLGDKVKGILVGGMKLKQEEYDEIYYDIICDVFKNIPKMFKFPNGHIKTNIPLIIGSKVKLEISNTNVSNITYL